MLVTLMTVLIVAGFTGLVVGVPLYRQGMYRELAASGAVLMLGLLIAAIQLFDLPVANPTFLLGELFLPVVELVHGMLLQ